ncbi:MAG: putative protein of unknown function, zinc metallopeptidase [Thermomicrobiales bacterium]|jgi:predicted metalloprotease|nr:putative protein of unknown function, zinc metallopeptidase [Thermomicrobiales bacterium]
MPRPTHLALTIAVLLLAPQLALISSVSAQVTPEAQRFGNEEQGYAGQFGEVLTELDAFWVEIFDASGALYRTPSIVALDQPVNTGCWPARPEDLAFYCPPDEGIYYSPDFFLEQERDIGDFVPIVVIAHEWGHHIQWLAGVPQGSANAFELQADCLAGAYASDAGQRGLLDQGDVTEAVAASAEFGDPLGLPQDAPGAHGINDDRVTSFMRGYLDGVTGCDLPLTSAPQPPSQPPDGGPAANPGSAPQSPSVVPPPELSTLVPSALELPHGQLLRLFDEGATTLEILASGFPDPVEATRLLQTCGWCAERLRRAESGAG